MESACPSSSTIFQNQYLIEKIFNSIEGGLMWNLNIRLVCKDFNTTCLDLIEKEHRAMDFRFLDKKDENEKPMPFVNMRPIRLSNLPGYYDFLTTVAGVQIQHLTISRICELDIQEGFDFHQNLYSKLIKDGKKLKSLTGLQEFCQCCPRCSGLASHCEEFGPINEYITLFRTPKHFKRLIINDLFLEQTANNCVEAASSKEQCHKIMLKCLKDLNVTCSKLVIWVSESRDTPGARDHILLPIEVLDCLLKIWSVESAEIKLIWDILETYHEDEWFQSNFFTEFRFNDPLGSWVSYRKISHIQVDLTESILCVSDLKSFSPDWPNRLGYENLIGNIIKVFNSDEISINFPHKFDGFHVWTQACLENFLRASMIGFHRSLTMNVKLFVESFCLEVVDGKVGFDIPEEFEVLYPVKPLYLESLPEKLVTEKWIGERCRFEDKEKKLEMNVDLYALEEDFKRKRAAR
ncbi:hypothetical protein CAEBREN_05992 [Caenorhabditis brenneri]|uniref:Uncharacterized protein n=1 Tax=Caenorhabditis brenneri TaxID=135651 RepID=G0NND0_CAEBE|nr:hypothetical protein CAEBREN_05992 [Caenorhabditis brenneri]